MRKRYQRSTNKKVQRARLLVVSEGEVTERQYISLLRRHYNASDSELVFLGPPPTSPKEIVVKARDTKRSQARKDAFDAVWVIFDVEAKVDQRQRPGLLEAINMAKKHGIELAISNPCFEIWILLHDALEEAFLTSDTAQHKCHARNLTKGKHLVNPERLLEYLDTAETNARLLKEKHVRDGNTEYSGKNPYTRMYRLIEAIEDLFDV